MVCLLKKKFVLKCLTAVLFCLVGSSVFSNMQNQEEIADFQAALYFLKYECDVNITDAQSQKITLNYIYQRRLFIDSTDSVMQEKLNAERFRDLASIDIPKETKCEALQKSFAPSLDLIK